MKLNRKTTLYCIIDHSHEYNCLGWY